MRRRPYLSFHGLLTHHCLICIQIPPLSISLTRLEEPVRTIHSLPPAYRCIQVGESTKAKMIECSGHVEPALRMGGCKVQQLTVELAVFGIGTLLSVRSFSSLLAFPLITLGVRSAVCVSQHRPRYGCPACSWGYREGQYRTFFHHINLRLLRFQFKTPIDPFIQHIIDPCKKAFNHAGLKSSDVKEVTLVCGMSRMPKVVETVKNVFGREPNRASTPVRPLPSVWLSRAPSCLEESPTFFCSTSFLSPGTEALCGIATRFIAHNMTIPTKKSQTFRLLLMVRPPSKLRSPR